MSSEELKPCPIIELVNKQAEDEGLWFQAETAPEGYLQQELRKLHAVIESNTRPSNSEGFERIANLEHDAESLECAHMYLDDLSVPTHQGDIKYSLVGRIKALQRMIQEDYQAGQQAGTSEWIAVEDDKNREGYCWIQYKGRIKMAYRHAGTYYFNNNLGSSVYMSECIKGVIPLDLPKLPCGGE